MKILIDNGHGIFTHGKRSPNGEFREAIYTREIARRVVADLTDRGHDAQLLVPEDDDIPLQERCRRANAKCLVHGKHNVILVSIHVNVNAAGNGTKWMNATGWSVYTSVGQTAADQLAICLCEAAIKNFPGRRIRTDWSGLKKNQERDLQVISRLESLNWNVITVWECELKKSVIDETISRVEVELASNKAKWETYLSRRKADREFARAEAKRICEIRAIVEKELEEQFHIPVNIRRLSQYYDD